MANAVLLIVVGENGVDFWFDPGISGLVDLWRRRILKKNMVMLHIREIYLEHFVITDFYFDPSQWLALLYS